MSLEEAGSTKRTRASGEVLEYLIREFHQNQNPSPEVRKEISERTNMSEKAVRIWFQNRRAKARKVEKYERNSSMSGPSSKKIGAIKNSGSIHSSRSNSLSLQDIQLQMSPNNLYLNQYINQLPIEINEKYCFIDIQSLSVGSWQRIKTGYHEENILKNNLINLSPFTLNNIMNNVDLLVILLKKNLEINYFFSAISNNSKILFRIFYPIDSILTCSLLDNNLDKENNELRLSLSHSPKFSVYFFNGVNSNSNQWSLCEDFSENQQVSAAHSFDVEQNNIIPHVLVGVKNSLEYLNNFILENNHSQHHPLSKITTGSNYPIDGESLNYRLKGLSPLGDFDSDNSPNSITSNNSHQINHETSTISNRNSRSFIPTSYHQNHDDNFNSNSNIISNSNSISNFTSLKHSNKKTPSTAPTSTSINNLDSNYDDIFNSNTPDFFSTVQTPTSTIMNYTKTFPNNPPSSTTGSTSGLIDSNLINSPSTNINSYTHINDPPNDQLLENDNNNNFSLNDQLHHTAFDLSLHNNDLDNSNQNQNFNLDGFGITSPGSNNDASTNGNTQVDSFIDFNSHYQ